MNKLFVGGIKEAIHLFIISIIIFSLSKVTPSYSGTIIFGTLLYIPVLSASVKKIDFLSFGAINIDWLKSFKYFMILSIIVFPSFYIVGFFFVKKILHGTVSFNQYPEDFLYQIFYQIAIVGLSEEFFYRGYLYSLMEKKYNKIVINYLDIDLKNIIISLLFSIGHFLTYFTFWSILTFFPSLLFGLLREKTGSIVAPILFHAFSNITLLYLQANIIFN